MKNGCLICIIILCLLNTSLESREITMEQSFQHLSLENSVEDILNHPAFQGFSDKILPWDDMPEQNISLRQIGRLMPYRFCLKIPNRLAGCSHAGFIVRHGIYLYPSKRLKNLRQRLLSLGRLCRSPNGGISWLLRN